MQSWSGLHVPAESVLSLLDDASEAIGLTSGRWSAVKLLALALKRVGQPAAIDCWSWTLSRRAIDRLRAWHTAGDVQVRLVVDSSLWRRQPSYGAALVASGVPFRACSTHVKAWRVSGPSGQFAMCGSGNLNLIRRAELVLLSRDVALAEWVAAMTNRAFASVPEGAPRGDAAARDAALDRAFPSVSVRPSWAAGLPLLSK